MIAFSIHSEVGGRTGCRLLVRDAAGDTESALLHEAVPSWVADVVIDRNIPRFIKIPFFLLPHPVMVKQDRMKKVRKLHSVLRELLMTSFLTSFSFRID
jgi:WD repeat-containing protein 48